LLIELSNSTFSSRYGISCTAVIFSRRTLHPWIVRHVTKCITGFRAWTDLFRWLKEREMDMRFAT
jgi:hypothetical protein